MRLGLLIVNFLQAERNHFSGCYYIQCELIMGYLVCATPTTVFFADTLKLYRCFGRGPKMCLWLRYTPKIIFCYILHVENIDFSCGITIKVNR